MDHPTKQSKPKINQDMRIATNLSALLHKNSVSCGQLANLLRIPVMTIRRLLSGETTDPRISTLKMLSNYFNIPVDTLISDSPNSAFSQNVKSYCVPKLRWDNLTSLNLMDKIALQNWPDWQSISLDANETFSQHSFALESRPSMYPRYPKGTLFIIDPQAKPNDGDIVLVEIKENNAFTLRELVIDPPQWRLSPLVPDSTTIQYHAQKHLIVGVCMLTMLYNSKLTG